MDQNWWKVVLIIAVKGMEKQNPNFGSFFIWSQVKPTQEGPKGRGNIKHVWKCHQNANTFDLVNGTLS